MDKVLIVDTNKKFLGGLSEQFSSMKHFDAVTTSKGAKALEILARGDISVLVTEIDVRQVDGLELLAYVTRKFLYIPCIVMSRFGKPWFFKSRDKKENLYYLEKPLTASSLSSAIMVALTLRDEGTSMRGFSLNSFLPIIEMAQKTCCLWVFSRKRGKGYLFFEKGVLVDAVYENATAEEAVRKMLTWDSIELFFSDLMHEAKKRRLNKDVIGLVGASWKRRDKFHSGELPDEKNSHRAEDISKVQLIAKKYLAVHYPRLKTIKGYKAVGVIADRLELVEGHDLPSVLNLKDSIPRNSCGIEPSSIFASMDMFDDCRMISIDAAEVTIQVLRCGCKASSPVYIVGVTEKGGNWVYMKHEMQKMDRYLSQLSK